MGSGADMDWRPSAQLRDLLTGATAWDDAHPAIRSWAMLTIHGAANTILAAPKPRRRAMIDKLPVTLRPILEAEIIRLARK